MRWIILLLLFIGGCSYDLNYSLDPYYVLNAAGVENYSLELEGDDFELGDIYLIKARMEDEKYYSKACKNYLKYEAKTAEERAIVYETLASLNCENKKEKYYFLASVEWKKIGVDWRGEYFNEVEFDTSIIDPIPTNIVGDKELVINSESKVITQVDRVYRDWLGMQIGNPFYDEILVVFSERFSYSKDELREDIGWHEGGRVKDLVEKGVDLSVGTGTMIAKFNGSWYAPDENGVFRFEVPLDKVSYPTTRFFSEDRGMIIDTHGVNMLVEQAIRNEVDVVIACGDHPGKAKASLYLSEKNISVISFPDMYSYLLVGHDANVLGSPVWKDYDDRIVYGGYFLEVDRVVVQDNVEGYGNWYYQSPMLYFSSLDVEMVVADDVYEKAREEGIDVVGVRIFNWDDYSKARDWMYEDEKNKVVLFHSTMYPYGIAFMKEFYGRVY